MTLDLPSALLGLLVGGSVGAVIVALFQSRRGGWFDE